MQTHSRGCQALRAQQPSTSQLHVHRPLKVRASTCSGRILSVRRASTQPSNEPGTSADTPSTSYSRVESPGVWNASRRDALVLLAGSAALVAAACPPAAEASKLGGLADSAWEALGGGPSDLVFPDEFVGGAEGDCATGLPMRTTRHGRRQDTRTPGTHARTQMPTEVARRLGFPCYPI